MSSITRKQFLEQLTMAGFGTAAMAAGTGLFTSSCGTQGAKALDSIGLQLYSIIPLLRQDFEGTLKTLAEIGYKEVEFAGPYYFTPGSEGLDSGFYGNDANEVRNLLDKYGLTGPAAHANLNTLATNLPEVLEAADAIGIRYLICPFLNAEQRQSIDDYKKLAEEFNIIGEKCNKAGVQFAYHNHSFEFGELEGAIPYNLLLSSTEPELVQMELDLFWISIAGYDPIDYFNEYPGRFPTVHVKDMKKNMVLDDPLNTFENKEIAMQAFGNLEDVGKGVLDFKRILSEHERAGIQHFFIERDRPPEPLQTIKNGYAYLSQLELG